MKIIETNIRQSAGTFTIEMALRESDEADPSQPYLLFRVALEAHPEGRPPLVELQREALRSAQGVIRDLLGQMPGA